jgi:hypothetical protein
VHHPVRVEVLVAAELQPEKPPQREVAVLLGVIVHPTTLHVGAGRLLHLAG